MFFNFFKYFNIQMINAIEIIIITFIIYNIIIFIRGTKAIQLIKGIIALQIIALTANLLNLNTIYILIIKLNNIVLFSIPIIFQPEIRKTLEKLGRAQIIDNNFLQNKNLKKINRINKIIDNIVLATLNLSKQKAGALIVFEQETGLKDYLEVSTIINANISNQLLENLFFHNSPLHDGAVIIQKEKILAAGCVLPLTDNPNLDKQLGTRHRAGIGLTEITDSVVLIVSEETGTISIAKNGEIQRNLNAKILREELENIYNLKNKEITNYLYNLKNKIWRNDDK